MFRKILAVAACAFAAVASAEGKLQFTQTPANAQVGVASTITWAGGEDGPVTLTLRKGPDSNNLATIGIITGNASGHDKTFDWTPDASIPPADDYALQISQGVDDTNYSGFFSILGGQAAVSTTIVAIGGSTTIPVTTLAPNSTSTTSVSITAILTSAASSSGTGTALPRNTTFVSQSLTSATFTGGLSAGSATPTSSSGAGATSGGSSASPSPSAGAAAVFKAQLGMGGIGAIAAAFFML